MASPEDALHADVTVVGAGAAGLYAALCASREGAHVALVSATPLAASASYWAQGGLAAALAADDSPERHYDDTVAAGRGAVRPSAARVLSEEAPDRARDLERLGVHFDADRHGALVLGLEGGHSVRRIVHAGGSATGRRITRDLSALIAEAPGVDVLEDQRARRLLVTEEGRCAGAVTADDIEVRSRAVILATGGAAAMWARTTNPAGTIGGGMLLAHAAGAALADLELVQFHPTAVMAPEPGREGLDGFLVTEAIRGEGALLLDGDGERFVDELAPRDEVARAIQDRMRESGAGAVALDMRTVDPTHFPNVVATLREGGLDPVRELVPVAPAAHYVMGGIATGLEGGSTLPGLYAVGECACTGLHGANRLASNSLSECFVFGGRAARRALDEPPADPRAEVRAHEIGRSPVPSGATRAALWEHAGLERSAAGLTRLLEDPHPLARVIGACALAREESRGAHRRSDAPATDPALHEHHAVVAPRAEPRFERWG